MSGFVRRYSDYPGLGVLQEIEGVVTIDQTAPGSVVGNSTGVACLVGEFADCTYGVAVDANGVVTTSPQPIEIFSGQDLTNKVGGFDETIGEFGGDGGNGWLELKNKSFSRLVVVPINIASSQGARLFRKLPTNRAANDPTPVVPITGGTVVAGREFKSGANRVRTAQRVQFTSDDSFASGIDGSVVAVAAAATQIFSSATLNALALVRPDGTLGVVKGDILVVGVIGGAAGLGANADTYRVHSITDATDIVVEKMDGTNFAWTTAAALPWRIHVPATADTGGSHHIAEQAGYTIPARPLDALIAINVNLTPTSVPAALTASGADALSGLEMRTDPVTGLAYTAAVQGVNAVSAAGFDALYTTAFDALLHDDYPANEVNIVWAARSSAVIDSKIESHCLTQKANGIGRIGLFSPPLDTTSVVSAVGDASPGVGNARYREGVYNWPGLQTFVGEAVGIKVKGADGVQYTNGILDTPSQGWAAAIFSQLAPERNPGQAPDPIKTIMSLALGIQRGVAGLGVNEYKLMRAKGIMGPRNDKTNGRIFQSGVTRSLQDGEREIYTRRFSFFVEDSVATILLPFSKLPMTESLKDQMLGRVHDFFDDLLSERNPAAARIRGYNVDAKSGNTPELSNAGIFVIKYGCEMVPLANTIVQAASVGYGVLNINQLQG